MVFFVYSALFVFLKVFQLWWYQKHKDNATRSCCFYFSNYPSLLAKWSSHSISIYFWFLSGNIDVFVSLVSVLKWYVKCIYYVYLPDCTYSLYTVLCLPYWSQRMQHNYSRIPCWTWTVQDRAPHGKHMQDTVVLPIPSCGVRCGAAWMIGFMRANKSPKKGFRKQVPKCCRSSKCHMLWASLPSDFYNIIFSSTGRCLLKYSVILCYDKLIVAVTVAMSLTGFTGLTPPETCLQKQSLVHLRCRLFVPCWNRNTSSTASGWLTQWLDISWISEAELSMHLAKLSLSLLSFTGLREPICCSMHKSLHRPQELLLCARLKG